MPLILKKVASVAEAVELHQSRVGGRNVLFQLVCLLFQVQLLVAHFPLIDHDLLPDGNERFPLARQLLF